MSAQSALDGVTRRRIRARASGKVNLQLTVGERDASGYHPLQTVFQAVDCYEHVTAAVRADGMITLTVDAVEGYASPLDGIPTDERNLAWRAAEAVREVYGIVDGVDLSIVKAVPTAGGMAGGSADAAAALVACAEAWDCGATRDELMRIGARLGADVPFAVLGHCAIGTGRGDVLTPALARGPFHWVFAMQHDGLSTPAVFAAFDEQLDSGRRMPSPQAVRTELMSALMSGDAATLGKELSNDLEDAAIELMPRLGGVIQSAKAAGALGALVSGSGPTVAALAGSAAQAQDIARELREAGVADAVLIASGPAGGAVVVS